MQKKYLVGLLGISLLTILLSTLSSLAVGLTVGGLLLLSFGAGTVIKSHIVFVHERTALVVCSRQHQGVLRVIQGPTTQLLRPFLETTGPVIDTKYQSEHIPVADVLQHDQQPTALGFTVTVMYRRAPHTLPPSRLGEILPVLTNSQPSAIQHWTDYYLRGLVADMDNPAKIHNSKRSQLETRLERMLTDKLAKLGIKVTTVNLVVWPPTGLQNTVEQVERQKVADRLQVKLLADFLQTLSGQSEQVCNLALLEIAKALGQNGHTFASLDLASMLNGNGSVASEADPTNPVQLRLLPEFRRPGQPQ